MNAARILGIIDGLCERATKNVDIGLLSEIRQWVNGAESEIESLTERASRFSGLSHLTDKQLATLVKFQSGHEIARVGRRSTVRKARLDIEWAWEYFFKIPALWRELVEKIEVKYPKSVVYKALKAL